MQILSNSNSLFQVETLVCNKPQAFFMDTIRLIHGGSGAKHQYQQAVGKLIFS